MTPPGRRRVVSATPDFFDQLDQQLPDERIGRTPSRSDFQAYELLDLIERFATDWDNLPEMYPGRPDYRLLAAAGRLVYAISVIGRLRLDGSIELIGIDIQLESPWGDEQPWDDN